MIGTAGSASLYYNERGTGVPVVLIHAFPLHSRVWLPQHEELPSVCRTILFDLPGFGLSEGQDGFESMGQCASGVVSLLDALGIEKAVMCGLSMGGYISMAVLRHHSDRVSGLILADTRAGADTDEGRVNRLRQAEDVRSHGMQVIVESLLPRLVSVQSLQVNPSLDTVLRRIMSEATPEATARLLLAMADRPDSSDVLARASVPVCVIVGSEDAITPVSEAEKMVSLVRNGRLHVIEGAGHLSNIEQPEAFNSIVKSFLKDSFLDPNNG